MTGTNEQRARELLPCPKCGCGDELTLDSERIAEASWIECGHCGYRFQQRCDEEALGERWNALSRDGMPAFNPEDVPPVPTTLPTRDAYDSMVSNRDWWYEEAKRLGAELKRLNAALAEPKAGAVPQGMIARVEEAARRIENGHAPRRIPADPTDVDLVLGEVLAWLKGEPAPFWVPTAPQAKPGDSGGGNP